MRVRHGWLAIPVLCMSLVYGHVGRLDAAPSPTSNCLTNVSFQASTGYWIGVNTGEGDAITATAYGPGPHELFTICRFLVEPIGGTVYTIHSDIMNRYLTFGPGPAAVVSATATYPVYFNLGCSLLGNTQFEYSLPLGSPGRWWVTSPANHAVEANSPTQPVDEYLQTWGTGQRICDPTGQRQF